MLKLVLYGVDSAFLRCVTFEGLFTPVPLLRDSRLEEPRIVNRFPFIQEIFSELKCQRTVVQDSRNQFRKIVIKGRG